METIIGVRFRTAGKIYHFSPGQLTIAKGQHVIVETARGMECGRVVTGPEEIEPAPDAPPLKVIQRIANAHDLQRVEDNRKHEKEARVICKKKIREHGLPMKLVSVEYTFDLNKIIFYFTADGRIDFRDLVKDLASVFRTRIELRQIGVRDEAKMMGGIGCCGRPLCCATFLGDFEPVSIRMAKEQNLSLNPTKISGICGRLMCCLKYESDCYCGQCPKQVRKSNRRSRAAASSRWMGKARSSLSTSSGARRPSCSTIAARLSLRGKMSSSRKSKSRARSKRRLRSSGSRAKNAARRNASARAAAAPARDASTAAAAAATAAMVTAATEAASRQESTARAAAAAVARARTAALSARAGRTMRAVRERRARSRRAGSRRSRPVRMRSHERGSASRARAAR